MAFGWTKTLMCKSDAWEDVHLPCSNSSRSLRDAIVPVPKISRFQKPLTLPKRDPNNESAPPSLCDLPLGHSSGRVVEIIFRSSWSPPFSGQIQMLFKVRHPPRTLAIFEDRRAAIRSRSDDPRCAADGNEMMRFHPAFPAAGGIYNASVVASAFGKMEGVRTFAGSAAAHKNAGGGPGHRAVLLCRVIAGRVGNSGQPEADSARIGPGFRGKARHFVWDTEDPRARRHCASKQQASHSRAPQIDATTQGIGAQAHPSAHSASPVQIMGCSNNKGLVSWFPRLF